MIIVWVSFEKQSVCASSVRLVYTTDALHVLQFCLFCRIVFWVPRMMTASTQLGPVQF